MHNRQQLLSPKQHADAIQRDGYTIMTGLLSKADMTAIREALAPYLGRRHLGRNNFEGHETERVYALLAKDPTFSRIIEHADVLAVLDQLLAPDYLLSANLAINTHPGETPQPFHRDNDGGPFATPGDIHGISTIWAFDEFTRINGATEIIPGSHLQQTFDEGRAIPAEMPAGSALVFSGSLVHRGGANHSDGTRLAITPQYCQPWLRQLENMVLSVPPEKAARLSPRVQALLGYSIRTPGFMGYVDGLHPRRLIDPDYQGRQARGESTINGLFNDA